MTWCDKSEEPVGDESNDSDDSSESDIFPSILKMKTLTLITFQLLEIKQDRAQ